MKESTDEITNICAVCGHHELAHNDFYKFDKGMCRMCFVDGGVFGRTYWKCIEFIEFNEPLYDTKFKR